MNKTFELSKPIPFKTAYSAAGDYRKYVGGFKFVSVLTDGAFNPQNNNRVSNPVALCPDRDNDSWCYLQFDNGERLQLNGEIRNFELPPDCKWLDLINSYAGITICGTDTPETGYNNMFILLSMSPVNLEIPKIQPCFEILNAEVLASGGEINYHIGIKKLNAADVLLFGYIPQDAAYGLKIIASADAPSSLSGSGVYGLFDDSDAIWHSLGSISFGDYGTGVGTYNSYDSNACRRLSINIVNMDMSNNHYVWIRGWLYRLG